MDSLLFLALIVSAIAGLILTFCAARAYDGITSLVHPQITTQIGPLIFLLLAALPEFAIGFMAHLANQQEMILGIIFGSNAALLALLGVIALLYGSLSSTSATRNDITRLFLFVAVPIMVLFDGYLHRLEGAVLIILFFFFQAAQPKTTPPKTTLLKSHKNNRKHHVFHLLAIPGIFVIAALIIYGLSQTPLPLHYNLFSLGFVCIGLLSVFPKAFFQRHLVKRGAIATTLSTTITSISINTGLILGSLAVIHPISLETTRSAYLYSVLYTVIAFFLIYLFTRSKRRLDRHEGFLLVLIYGLFLLALLMLGR